MIGESDPWDKLAKKLIQMETDTKEAVLTGRPKTIEDYREQVGYLQAVTEIRETIAAIFSYRKTNSFMEQ